MSVYGHLFLVLALGSSVRCDGNSTSISSGYELDEGSASQNGELFSSSSCLPQQPNHTNCSSELWLWRKKDSCECGEKMGGIVRCEEGYKEIGLLQCYCIYNIGTKNASRLVVGSCLYGCYTTSNTYFHLYTSYSSVDDLNIPCETFNRSGQFCGGCDGKNMGVPAYSFSLKCRLCTFSWKNIVKYIAIAYGPLTIFFVIIVVFTVSVNSAPLHGYIFVAQIMAASIVMRILQALREVQQLRYSQYSLIKFGATVYGFWNLDFFRFANQYYCLHPSFTTLTVMSLDYLIAIYPIMIIVLMYVMVELHGRGYRVLVFLWKPLNCCFVRFRHKLNIRTSLVDAFGTFFSLSFVKFLSTTVDLMAATPVWDVNGTRLHSRMYYDGRLSFFHGEHLWYAVISLICFTLFNVFPIILLLLYPRRCFQKRIPTHVRRILHPFMDTMLGIYKDGSDGSYDCRFFVVFYLIARIAIFSMLLVAFNSFCFILVTIVTTVTAMLVAVLKPYKSATYNTVDTILVTLLALTYAGFASFFFANTVSSQQLPFARFLAISPLPFPFFYVCGLVLYRLCVSFRLPRRTLRMLQCIILCFGRAYLYLTAKLNKRQEMEGFPSLDERTLLIPIKLAETCMIERD